MQGDAFAVKAAFCRRRKMLCACARCSSGSVIMGNSAPATAAFTPAFAASAALLTKGAVPPLARPAPAAPAGHRWHRRAEGLPLRCLFQRRAGLSPKRRTAAPCGGAPSTRRAAPYALPAGQLSPLQKAAIVSPGTPSTAPFGSNLPAGASPAGSPDCVPGALLPPAAALPGGPSIRRASSATGCPARQTSGFTA